MATTTYPQRSEYMAGQVTHEQFYRSVARTAGIHLEHHPRLNDFKVALANGDKYLNTIPLKQWDIWAVPYHGAISRSLKLHGDFYSDAGAVCTLKQAAIEAATK